jgi:hypothetical protein
VFVRRRFFTRGEQPGDVVVGELLGGHDQVSLRGEMECE